MNNKRIRILSLFGFMLVMLAVACNQTTESNENRANLIEFDTIQVNEVYLLDNKEGYPSCNLQMTLVYPSGSELYDLSQLESLFICSALGQDYKNMNIADALKGYTEMYIQNYRADAEVYRRDRPKQKNGALYGQLYDLDSEVGELPKVFYSYFETIENEVVYDMNGIISFQVVQVNDKGGVASHEQVFNFTYDLEAEEWINEEDVFEPGYDEALRPVIQELLMAAKGVRTIQELEDLGFFGVEEIIPNNNILLTDKGIVYTFNKGEFSAYHLSPAEIVIPYGVVRSLLKEGSPIDRLPALK